MRISDEIRKKWPPRPKTAHKGDFGRVLVIAGSQGMSGAAVLTGMSALRTGAGLVTLAVPEAVYLVTARKYLDLMVRPFPSTQQGSLAWKARENLLKLIQKQDVVALGPGLSQNSETQKTIRFLISQSSCPLVLDADGLSAFQKKLEELKFRDRLAVLTPHPGEFVRLFGGKLSSEQALRKKRARAASKLVNAVLVLKGHRTVVAWKGKIYENRTGNPGMAKAGFGDVLTGMIAALLAQKMDVWDAGCFGVYLHGLAGDEAVKIKGEAGLIATDLIDQLPATLKKIRKC